MKWLAEAVLMAAVVLLKSIPAVGAAPWACALVDALFLFVLILFVWAQRRPSTAFLASVLMPVLDWAQGAIPALWVPFIAAGFILAAKAADRLDRRIVTRGVCALLWAYLLRVLGVTLGYVLLKDMALWTALKSVVRNSWYVFAWYAAAVAAAAGLYCRRMSKIQN